MAFCTNCGAQVDGRFCQKCGAPAGDAAGGGAAPVGGGGAPVGGGPVPMGPTPMTSAAMPDNTAGALCYLFGLITGILFLVLSPYNQNRNVKFHAFQSIFFNVAWIGIWIVLSIITISLHVIPIMGAILSLFLHFALWVGGLIAWFYLMYKTYNGEKIILPVIGPLADKQANS